jgi:hypothetical protein
VTIRHVAESKMFVAQGVACRILIIGDPQDGTNFRARGYSSQGRFIAARPALYCCAAYVKQFEKLKNVLRGASEEAHAKS